MSDLLNYLNNPNLVANFQKIFGIEADFNLPKKIFNINNNEQQQQQSPSSATATTTTTTTTVKRNLNNSIRNKSTNNSSSLSNNELTSNNTKTKSHLNGDLNSTTTTTTGAMEANNDENENYKIHNKFWFYLFHIGAAMGNEIFYSLFFPFWFWNVDGAIARKVSIVWALYMYLGQATKDILEMPRPATPPVVKLEKRYIQEYGFPSTHAMVAAGLPASLVFLSHSRYNINLPISIALATVFCLWVCASRLYLGMHSLLDVIAGVLYSIVIFLIVSPFLDTIDRFQLTNTTSPIIVFLIGLALCYYYPSIRQWSTARGDTVIIIGTVVGFSIGSHFNYVFGFLYKPLLPPLYDINFPSTFGYVLVVIRTILGLLMLLSTRFLFKHVLLRFLCYISNMDYRNANEVKKEKKIELPYYYLTYFAIGFNVAFSSPFVFRLLHIARDYTFTEL